MIETQTKYSWRFYIQSSVPFSRIADAWSHFLPSCCGFVKAKCPPLPLLFPSTQGMPIAHREDYDSEKWHLSNPTPRPSLVNEYLIRYGRPGEEVRACVSCLNFPVILLQLYCELINLFVKSTSIIVDGKLLNSLVILLSLKLISEFGWWGKWGDISIKIAFLSRLMGYEIFLGIINIEVSGWFSKDLLDQLNWHIVSVVCGLDHAAYHEFGCDFSQHIKW